MFLRIILLLASAIALLTFSTACGGSGSSSVSGGSGAGGTGGNGGGGGGFPAPKVTLVAPSQINTNAAFSENPIIYGSGFTTLAEVEINGTAVPTLFQNSTDLWTQVPSGTLANPNTYSVTVNDIGGQSNALPLVVYTPTQGPQPFWALPGYFPGVESPPTAIATADFNGDGRDDVVINAGPYAPGIAVLRGQADGTLGTPQYISTNGGSTLAAGDVNGDGYPDVVVGTYPASATNANTSSFTLLLNDGTGSFTTGQTLSFSGTFPDPMVLADIRGTGRNDLLIATNQPSTLYLFPNQGNGTFGQPVVLATLGPEHWFAVADMNGDGLPDIVYVGVNTSTGSENTHLLINQGGGTFDDIVPAALANTGGIMTVGDFNNDGRPDVAIQVIANQQPPIPLKIFLNTGNNSFSLASTLELGSAHLYQPYRFAVGDFDHDGNLDIAAENSNGTYASSVLLLWGDGTGNFAPQEVIGPSGFEITTGDINGDGIPDLLIPDETLGITALLGQVGRTFKQPSLLLSSAAAVSMAAGDVNGDGFPDLLLVAAPSTIFLNDGHGNFTPAGNPPVIGTGAEEKLVDLNRNGKADLLGLAATSSGGESIVIYPATGDPNYSSAPITIPIPLGITFTAGFDVADLDGDGLPDIIFDAGIAWNQGNYQFAFAPLNTNGVLGIGDVNGDNRLDLIAANGTFLNQGNRQFTNIPLNGLPLTSGYQVVFGDFNGDGIVDVAFANVWIEQYIGVAYGHGDGTFDVQSNFATSGPTLGNVVKLVAGDLNHDGLTDLVVPLLLDTHVEILTSVGNGQFQTSYFATGTGAQDILEMDLNGDGKPDLILLPPTPSNIVEIVFGE